MNRIILIGNGFDLAHGLKTSYNDFIDWIIESKHIELEKNGYQLNDIDIKYNKGYFNKNIPIEELKKVFCKNKRTSAVPRILGENTYYDNNKYGTVEYKNTFLKLIIQSRYVKGWADIETMFYDELNKLLNNDKTTDNEINLLNNNFQRIINLLEIYLTTIKENFNSSEIKDRITSLLNLPIYQSDLSIEFKRNNKSIRGKFVVAGEEIEAPNVENYDKCLIIDFNYTQIIKHYFYENKFHYVNIHGELNNPDNKMIFGFGDELDDDYIKIEKSRLKGVMNYIKSINYLNTVNYRNVLEFLEIENYQVFVWGHSCGLTDRTLLNHIFEHNNCAGIKPYYYQKYDEEAEEHTNNYIEIVVNIARNFKNKNKLRDRVVNLDYCEPLIK